VRGKEQGAYCLHIEEILRAADLQMQGFLEKLGVDNQKVANSLRILIATVSRIQAIK
jgi:hypothetical protein